jgi:DNA-binding IclR family transcriptional regulator
MDGLEPFVEESNEPKPRIQSAVRTVQLLLSISESSNGLKAKEIMEMLKLSRQVTYHLIHTLHTTGIIRKNENSRYVLGLAAVSIAEGFRRQLAPPEHLARRVRTIVAATGETAHAGGWVGEEIVALATARGESPVGAAQIPEGFSGHAHARATGKLLLAYADKRLRETYLSHHPLIPRTSNTIIDYDKLQEDLELIRTRGYAVDNEEFHEGLRCMAVPVQGANGRFALGISVPSARFETNFERYLAILQNAARING